jgi:hypothetical protein
MNALEKCRKAKNDVAAQRRAADEAEKAKDAADHCDALERFADDGGSWICPPSESRSYRDKRKPPAA